MSQNHDHSTASRPDGPATAWWGLRVWRFYRDGFRDMTVGRTLWAIIAIKLFVFFVIIRWLLLPDFLGTKAADDQGKAQYVRERLTGQ